MRSASSFTFEPLFIVLGIVALVAYGRAWRRERAGVGHAVAFAAGIVLIVAALNSPLETIAIDYLVLFHLLQNVIIADWAPPLLILGLTPAMRGAIARRGGRPFAFATKPIRTSSRFNASSCRKLVNSPIWRRHSTGTALPAPLRRCRVGCAFRSSAGSSTSTIPRKPPAS